MTIPSEHQEQTELFHALAVWATENPLAGLAYAVPNGGHRAQKVANMLRDEGVKPGVPDVFWPVPRGRYHGMYLELKRRAHRNEAGRLVKPQPSAKQRQWMDALRAQSYFVVVAWGCDQALEWMRHYWALGGFHA